MKKKDFAALLRLKHAEGDKILVSEKSDGYFRAYAFGVCDACNDLLKQIGMEEAYTSFEQEIIEERKRQILSILSERG